MAKPKFITHETYLQALGLFSLASNHAQKARQFERALCELLRLPDEDYGGCISDQLYESQPNFDRGLKNEGFEVRPPKKQPGKRAA